MRNIACVGGDRILVSGSHTKLLMQNAFSLPEDKLKIVETAIDEYSLGYTFI